MRGTVRRHLGKVMAGAAVAVAGTAVMVAITLPGTAGADEKGGGGSGSDRSAQADRADGGGGAVAPGVVRAAPAEGEKGKGLDPLTDDEVKRVERIALNRQLLDSGESVTGARGPQRLTVELAEPDADEVDAPDAARRADVTYYDYRDDSVVTRTVDLDTGKVVETSEQHGVQPPLSLAEQTEAARLLIADPLGAGLKADYKDATGKELTSPDQLTLTSMVFRAVPGVRPAALTACGEHRCTRLFPKIKNGAWIDTRDFVIDLSARKVVRLG
ncbi:Tat pathway signal sequence domain protein [Streptomyces sp. YIM S03343]